MITETYAGWLGLVAIYGIQSAFDKVLSIGPDFIGVKTINTPDGDVICFDPEGTIDWEMWESNFRVDPIHHPILGKVHSGMFSAAAAIYLQIKPLADGKKIVISAHSRGAGIGVFLAAMFLMDGIKVELLLAFECPKVGCQQFANFLANQHRIGHLVDFTSTVNLLDPVPVLPELIEPPYCAPLPTTQLNRKPGGLRDLDPVAYHMEDVIYPAWLAYLQQRDGLQSGL